MRASEFVQEAPIKPILRDYIAKGYKVLNRGASAMVLGSPDGREVIKVGPTNDCWLQFAERAKHDDNPHVPKILALNTYGKHYLARIEHLSEVPDTFFKNVSYLRIASWMLVYGKWKTPRDIYLARFTPGQIKKLANDLEREDPQMADALKMVVSTKGACNYDLHPENLMKRGSTLVVSDPLTHQG